MIPIILLLGQRWITVPLQMEPYSLGPILTVTEKNYFFQRRYHSFIQRVNENGIAQKLERGFRQILQQIAFNHYFTSDESSSLKHRVIGNIYTYSSHVLDGWTNREMLDPFEATTVANVFVVFVLWSSFLLVAGNFMLIEILSVEIWKT